MKRYNNLYQKIYSFKNLYFAYLKARKGKRYRKEVLKFSFNLEANLFHLREELLNQNYKHGFYKTFIVNDSKKRLIKAAPFRDRVVHHALCNIIEPIFDKGFIFDSYACRKGKGTHKAAKRLDTFIKSIYDKKLSSKNIYCLQADISKYFASIDHTILVNFLEKKIKDKKTLWLAQEIIKSSYDNKIPKESFGFRFKGIPIGNLTSQLFANIYLNQLDQFIKHQLNIKYYFRYMDDLIILSLSKAELHKFKELIHKFLRKKLMLEFHFDKVNIFPIKQGIDILGYRFFRNYKLLRKNTVKRFIKRTKIYQHKLEQSLMKKEKFEQSIQSYLAYAEFADSWNLCQQLSAELGFNVII